jgi:hypothetical protein
MTRAGQLTLVVCTAAWIALLCASGGCGSGGSNPDNADGSDVSDDGGRFGIIPDATGSFGGDGSTIPAACPGGGLECYVPGGCTTSLSGTVYDPAGRNPLYNVVVFIPNDPLGALPVITPGTHTCNTCDVSIGNYVAVTTTDSNGHFTLTGVPATTHVPLVVQTGKWRREVFLPPVTACTDNAVAATNSRLPKSRTEGDLPQMALLTGGCDDLGCFMKSMGIDDAEYTAPHGGGRLDIYQGVGIRGSGASLSSGRAGNCTGPGCPLWASKQSFEYYDIAILSCECAENNQTKPPAGMRALHDWLGEGGKVFASHYHYTWFKNSPLADFQKVATWLGMSNAEGRGNYSIDTSFPKGKTYRDWLSNVGALAPNGSIALNSVATSVSTVNAPTTRWIYDSTNNETKYLSFLTPIGGIAPALTPDAGVTVEAGVEAGIKAGLEAGAEAGHEAGLEASVESDARADARTDAEVEPDAEMEAAIASKSDAAPPMEVTGPQYCGKAVFTDLHTSASLYSQVNNIPAGCDGAPMTAQQKALEYLFFDLSACVSTDDTPPPPPPPPTR